MPPEAAIAVLTHKVETMHEDLGEMRSALRQLLEAFNRLTLIDERQAQMARSLERAFLYMEKMEGRVAALEQQAPANRQTSAWVSNGLWAAAAAALTYAAKKVGLL